MEETIYDFEFNREEIQRLKMGLIIMGLEISENMELFNKLCEAVKTHEDDRILKDYA